MFIDASFSTINAAAHRDRLLAEAEQHRLSRTARSAERRAVRQAAGEATPPARPPGREQAATANSDAERRYAMSR